MVSKGFKPTSLSSTFDYPTSYGDILEFQLLAML